MFNIASKAAKNRRAKSSYGAIRGIKVCAILKMVGSAKRAENR